MRNVLDSELDGTRKMAAADDITEAKPANVQAHPKSTPKHLSPAPKLPRSKNEKGRKKINASIEFRKSNER